MPGLGDFFFLIGFVILNGMFCVLRNQVWSNQQAFSTCVMGLHDSHSILLNITLKWGKAVQIVIYPLYGLSTWQCSGSGVSLSCRCEPHLMLFVSQICRQITPEGGGRKLLNICAWKTENRLLPCPLDTLPASQAVGQYKAGMRAVQS